MKITPFDDVYFMKQAISLARQAGSEGEIPVGAVIVAENQIVGRGYNQTERLHDCTAHAEMIALTSAFQYFGAKYLPDCRIFVTLEPCVMCAGAIAWSQISSVIYGAEDLKKGYRLFSDQNDKGVLSDKVKVTAGVLAQECGEMVDTFFRKIRKAN